jgi:outer membrane protein TolC
MLTASAGFSQEPVLKLDDIVQEALRNNPEIKASEAGVSASRYRISQASSLPDPSVSVGYQNYGFNRYTYGESSDSQWMFSASQTFPYPGKRSLKEAMTLQETESLTASHDALRLRVTQKVKELYYDLFLSHKNIALIKGKTLLSANIEESALARYASNSTSQQDVIMAQEPKYMLMEKEAMEQRRIESLEAMLNQALGRNVNAKLGIPEEPVSTPFDVTLDELLQRTDHQSPDLASKDKMVKAAESRLSLSKKEAFPDFTLSAGYFNRQGEFKDMWSLSLGISLPIFYASKQQSGINEVSSNLAASRYERENTRIMLQAGVRDNWSMIKAADRLMKLYSDGLIPRTNQDFTLSLSGYRTGAGDVTSLISKLTSLYDYEFAYWQQLVEREKAIARIEAITGTANHDKGEKAK